MRGGRGSASGLRRARPPDSQDELRIPQGGYWGGGGRSVVGCRGANDPAVNPNWTVRLHPGAPDTASSMKPTLFLRMPVLAGGLAV